MYVSQLLCSARPLGRGWRDETKSEEVQKDGRFQCTGIRYRTQILMLRKAVFLN